MWPSSTSINLLILSNFSSYGAGYGVNAGLRGSHIAVIRRVRRSAGRTYSIAALLRDQGRSEVAACVIDNSGRANGVTPMSFAIIARPSVSI